MPLSIAIPALVVLLTTGILGLITNWKKPEMMGEMPKRVLLFVFIVLAVAIVILCVVYELNPEEVPTISEIIPTPTIEAAPTLVPSPITNTLAGIVPTSAYEPTSTFKLGGTMQISIDKWESFRKGDIEVLIDECEPFYNGFYFENDDVRDRWAIIYHNEGIQGKFHYSRELTQHEKENWSHGGELLDTNYMELSFDDFTRWSHYTGDFAMQFPKYLSPGQYIYRFHQNMSGGIQCGAYIYFTVR